jgi:hypothetical protein
MTCGRLTPKVSSSSQRTVSSYFPSLPFSLLLDPPLLDSQVAAPWASRDPGPPSPPRLLPGRPCGTRLARGFPFYLRCPLFSLLRTSQVPGHWRGGCWLLSVLRRLPSSFQVNRVSEDVQYEQGSQDFKNSWVQPSHFCEGGGLGLFFKVERRGLRVGACIGVYAGRCNKNRDDYAAALVRFAASDYVLSDKPHRFVVDGQHNDVICGPARSNDNFDIVNCYFAYNPTLRRLELITRAPLEEGIYEALTNYDIPGEFSAYWTAERLSYLSDEARARCLAYYHP